MSFHLPGNTSLKGKRSSVRRIVERTRSRFNASVAEVGDNDVLQRATVGIAVIGNSGSHVDSMLGKITGFVEGIGAAVLVSRETEVIPLGGELGDGPLPPELPPDFSWYDNDGNEEE